MPGYIERALLRFQHPLPSRPQHSPHAWIAPHYGAPTQLTDHPDNSAALPANGKLFIQQVIGVLLWYARAVDNTLLVALGTLASAQSNPTDATMAAVAQILNYCATHPDAVVRYKASGMALHIHSDASYLSASQARSRVGGYFFLSDTLADPKKAPSPDSPPPPFNGPILINSAIMKSVLSSPQKPNSAHSFLMRKTAPCCVRCSKTSATRKPPLRSKPTMLVRPVLQTTQSSNAAPKPSTCASIGYETG